MRRLHVVLIVLATSAIAFGGVASAEESLTYPITGTQHGKTLKQFVTEYGKWSVRNDGVKGCSIAQPAAPIVFLPSVATKGKSSFTCSFPAGSKILVLGGFNMCWTDPKTTRADLPKQCAPSSLKVVTKLKTTVDGVPLDTRRFLVSSSMFTANLPAKNTFGVKAGPTTFLMTGWFPLLRPLAPGKHVINGVMSIKDYGTFDVTYNVTITN